MDCERCESLLVDYVSGTLAQDEAAEFRAALDVCEHCRLALGKLERGQALAKELPQLEPPPAMFAAVMRAAEARAAELAAERESVRVVERSASPARVAARDEARPLDGVWAWLAGLLHGPQFAMAALLVLMVGVGLWWVPALSGPHAPPPPLVSDTPPALGPSASLAPVETPHLEVDTRTGRVVPSGEGSTRATPERPAAPRVAALDEAERAPTAIEPLDDDEDNAELDAERLAGAIAAVELGAGDSYGLRTEEAPLPGLAPPPSSAPATGLRSSSAGDVPGSALGGAERVERSALDEDSVPAPAPDDSMLPASLHAQARSFARAGSLADATRAYERLLSDHADYASAPRAMIELAEVYRRSGSLSRARAWLDRASRYPSVATEVGRERGRLEAMERAALMDRASDSTGAAESERAGSADLAAPHE